MKLKNQKSMSKLNVFVVKDIFQKWLLSNDILRINFHNSLNILKWRVGLKFILKIKNKKNMSAPPQYQFITVFKVSFYYLY